MSTNFVCHCNKELQQIDMKFQFSRISKAMFCWHRQCVSNHETAFWWKCSDYKRMRDWEWDFKTNDQEKKWTNQHSDWEMR